MKPHGRMDECQGQEPQEADSLAMPPEWMDELVYRDLQRSIVSRVLGGEARSRLSAALGGVMQQVTREALWRAGQTRVRELMLVNLRGILCPGEDESTAGVPLAESESLASLAWDSEGLTRGLEDVARAASRRRPREQGEPEVIERILGVSQCLLLTAIIALLLMLVQQLVWHSELGATVQALEAAAVVR